MTPDRILWFSALAVLLALVGLQACDEEDPYIHCPFSNTIEKTCVQKKDSVGFTCVVASHPFCSQQICVSWVESDPFCSQGCQVDAECPDGGRCVTHLDNPSNPEVPPSVCVPEAILCGDSQCQEHEDGTGVCDPDCD